MWNQGQVLQLQKMQGGQPEHAVPPVLRRTDSCEQRPGAAISWDPLSSRAGNNYALHRLGMNAYQATTILTPHL